MNNWANGKTAFVTGATSGFGLAFAKRILAGGGKVIAIGRRIERLEAFRDEAKTENLFISQLDITNKEAIKTCIDNLPPEFADIDILYNNAGLALGLGSAEKQSLEDWDTMVNTNITGLIHITHKILQGMIARNKGDIINLSSVAGTYPYPGGNVYGGTKAFVKQFSLNLRADLIGKNIRVTSVEPGMCETEFSVVRFAGDKSAADNVYEGMTPLSADDIALTCESILRLPAHVNINRVEIMPVQQAFSPFAVDRSK